MTKSHTVPCIDYGRLDVELSSKLGSFLQNSITRAFTNQPTICLLELLEWLPFSICPLTPGHLTFDIATSYHFCRLNGMN